MPVITIAGNPGISVENKRKMVKKVSEAVAEGYNLPIETITILIQAIPADNVGVAGGLLIDKK